MNYGGMAGYLFEGLNERLSCGLALYRQGEIRRAYRTSRSSSYGAIYMDNASDFLSPRDCFCTHFDYKIEYLASLLDGSGFFEND